MRAADIMTRDVISVRADTTAGESAALLLGHHISAVPVVDAVDHLIGIVSENDLLRRPPTESPGAWWLSLFGGAPITLEDVARSRTVWASEIMTHNVLSIIEEAPLDIISTMLGRHRLRRLPVVRDGKLVGIVSRADVLRGLAGGSSPETAGSDRMEATP